MAEPMVNTYTGVGLTFGARGERIVVVQAPVVPATLADVEASGDDRTAFAGWTWVEHPVLGYVLTDRNGNRYRFNYQRSRRAESGADLHVGTLGAMIPR